MPRRTLALWSALTGAEVMFHHANWRLPARVDRALAWLVVTPRLHGLHHAADERLQHANYSSGLSVWDRLAGTFRDDVAQRDITIGLPR